LDVTARYREEMLLSKYRLAQANIQRFEEEGPFGWAFPLDQADPFALRELLDKLDLLGVEVSQTTEPIQQGGRTFPEETVVVTTSQAFGGFVKTLFERQEYPDLRQKTHLWQGIPRRIEVEGGPLRPYDVAGWTLPLQMGLETFELDGPASNLPLRPVTDFSSVLPYGSPSVQSWAVTPGRVAVYRPWQGSMDEGWIRWILEHYDFPMTELRNDRVRAGDLKGDFDTIVLPSVRAQTILEGNREGSLPPQYVGGIGEEGLEALKEFARGGGTLFFHEGSTDLALREFDLPLQEVSGRAREAGFYSAGSILRFSWDPDSPLTLGMDSDGVAFVSSRGSLFEITGDGEGIVGTPRVVG